MELRDDSTVSYTHNSVNQYVDIGGCDPDVAHDDNGNLTRDHRGYEYQYDVDNRLIYVYNDSDAPYGEYDPDSDDTLYAQYEYDAMGRRIYSKIASAEKKYIYDGQRVIVETDGDGVFERRFVFGNYIDEVLIVDDGTDDYYYGHDHLYSVVALFNDTGSVVERYEYDAYGKCTVFTNMADWAGETPTTARKSALGNPYTFTGRRLDELTSNLAIMYYRARYYDPEVGRFMQMDSLGYIDSMNMHQYVLSNPVKLIDPSGNASSIAAGIAVNVCKVIAEKALDETMDSLYIEIAKGIPTHANLYKIDAICKENETKVLERKLELKRVYMTKTGPMKGIKLPKPNSSFGTPFSDLIGAELIYLVDLYVIEIYTCLKCPCKKGMKWRIEKVYKGNNKDKTPWTLVDQWGDIEGPINIGDFVLPKFQTHEKMYLDWFYSIYGCNRGGFQTTVGIPIGLSNCLSYGL